MTMKQLELSGRVAVVIGGTSGIGLALTQGLAEGGQRPHRRVLHSGLAWLRPVGG